MKKYILMLPLMLLLVFCNSKKTSLQDDDDIEVADFIEFFPDVHLPVRLADTSLLKKETDTSLQISYKIFTRFIPDSIIQQDFGKNAKPVFTAVGKVKEEGKETYLFAKAVAGSKRVGYVFTFNRKEQFLRAMPLVRTGFAKYTSAYGALDNKFQITTYQEKRGSGELIYKKNVYFYNREANDFTLIFTEPNEEMIENVINPIDTMSKKHKYAGDYVKDKHNFVSVRDGRPGELTIFIHFEKDNGSCNGEVKGPARLINNTTAQYYQPGNPCAIELSFTATRVRLKETGGCGTYRDIKCFFDGTYNKKKSP